MHDLCMSTKTISLELDAYEKLKRAKKDPRESFSSVVRRAKWDDSRHTCGELLEFMTERRTEQSLLGEKELDRLEKRQKRPTRSASHWARR